MKTSIDFIKININKFLDSYAIFAELAMARGFTHEDSIALYNIYINKGD